MVSEEWWGCYGEAKRGCEGASSIEEVVHFEISKTKELLQRERLGIINLKKKSIAKKLVKQQRQRTAEHDGRDLSVERNGGVEGR